MGITIVKTKSSYFADTAEEPDFHFFDIYAEGNKVGSVEVIDRFDEENETCYVERIDIDEEFRGQGIGTEVLTSTLWNECGYRYVVVAPDNENAQRLYERIGTGYVWNPESGETDFSYNDQGYGVYVI